MAILTANQVKQTLTQSMKRANPVDTGVEQYIVDNIDAIMARVADLRAVLLPQAQHAVDHPPLPDGVTDMDADAYTEYLVNTYLVYGPVPLVYG